MYKFTDCDGTLPTVINGVFVPQGDGTFGDIAELHCDPGFQMVGSTFAIACQADSTWSETSASCIPVGKKILLIVTQNNTFHPSNGERDFRDVRITSILTKSYVSTIR